MENYIVSPKIAAALVAAQKAFGPALKTSDNPHFRSKYADLASVVEAVIDGLNDNGIYLVQKTHDCDDGSVVETVFVHSSGETFSAGRLHVPASKRDAHGYMSALTYARRYSLMAACGIAPEDDDGNNAAASPPGQKAMPQPSGKAPVAPKQDIQTDKRLQPLYDQIKKSREALGWTQKEVEQVCQEINKKKVMECDAQELIKLATEMDSQYKMVNWRPPSDLGPGEQS